MTASGPRATTGELATADWLRPSPFVVIETALWVICTEVVCDLLVRWRLWNEFNPFGVLVRGVLRLLHAGPILEYAVQWLVPLVVICAVVGYRTGKSGPIAALGATGLFLLTLHSFRGVAQRHNVFEFAEMWTRWRPAGVAAPWVWDAMYLVAAPLAAAGGMWLARRAAKRPMALLERMASLVAGRGLLLAGIACLVVGGVETWYTVAIAWPSDSLISMPRINHFAALLACGVIGVTARWWKGPVEEWIDQ